MNQYEKARRKYDEVEQFCKQHGLNIDKVINFINDYLNNQFNILWYDPLTERITLGDSINSHYYYLRKRELL